MFAKAKTKANTARRRTVLFLGRIFERFLKLSSEKVCFAISTKMPASMVYSHAKKKTNYF